MNRSKFFVPAAVAATVVVAAGLAYGSMITERPARSDRN
jgi:hypothetical protein